MQRQGLVRQVLAAVVGLVCVALLSSCALLSPGGIRDDSKQQSDVAMQHIADAVKNHDAAALKKLFSPVAREKATDLDSGVKYFLSLFPSCRMTWKSEGTGSGGINEYGKKTVELFANYEVFADGRKYDLYFADFTVNQVEDPNNIGLYALAVAPHNAEPYTKPTASSKAFNAWAGQFENVNGKTTGNPGVYVPQK